MEITQATLAFILLGYSAAGLVSCLAFHNSSYYEGRKGWNMVSAEPGAIIGLANRMCEFTFWLPRLLVFVAQKRRARQAMTKLRKAMPEFTALRNRLEEGLPTTDQPMNRLTAFFRAIYEPESKGLVSELIWLFSEDSIGFGHKNIHGLLRELQMRLRDAYFEVRDLDARDRDKAVTFKEVCELAGGIDAKYIRPTVTLLHALERYAS